jgi:hypothetical protein
MTAETLTFLVADRHPIVAAHRRRHGARALAMSSIELGVARRWSDVLEEARRPQALRCWVRREPAPRCRCRHRGVHACGKLLHVLDDDPPYVVCTAWHTDPRAQLAASSVLR